MPVKPGRMNTGESGKLRYAQGRCNPTIPCQATEPNPGDKDCGWQLRVENQVGGDENPTRREQGVGHQSITRIVWQYRSRRSGAILRAKYALKKQIETIILLDGVMIADGYI